MEKDPAQKRAESLEKTIQNHTLFLKKAVEEFQKKCLSIFPQKSIPLDQVIEIRDGYKEIRNRLTEVKATQQLVKEKYRSYGRKDPVREKELNELEAQAETCYSKFEYTLMQREAQKKAKEREGALRVDQKGVPFQWFHSKEKQVTFVRNRRILNDLDYERSPHLETEERRETTPNRPRSLTLFVFSGEEKMIDNLQSRIQLREHDIIERYARDELHGLLAHLREIDPIEVEKKFKEFIGRQEFSKLKCLLLSVHPSKNLEGDLLGLVKKALQGMREGEVKTLSI